MPPLNEREDTRLHLDRSGSSRAKPQTPKAISALGQARESFARTCIAGVVMLGLLIALGIALWKESDHVHSILLILGSGLGYLLGSRDWKSED